jgi:uncharacterized membrane protein
LIYNAILTLHILFAIVAVGFNASYGIWTARARRDPANLAFALRGIKFMDDYVANPCYILLLLSGLAMAFVVGHWGWQRWIISALVLWAILAVVGFAGYTPTLSRQIRVLAAEGPDSPAYRALDSRGRVLGIVLGVIVLVILGLMVLKPSV